MQLLVAIIPLLLPQARDMCVYFFSLLLHIFNLHSRHYLSFFYRDNHIITLPFILIRVVCENTFLNFTCLPL